MSVRASLELGRAPAWAAPLLAAGEGVYRAAVATRTLLYDRGWLPAQRVSRPVISVGNLTAGGNGKTPLVIWIARLLAGQGRHVAVVSRGYGAREPPKHAAIVSRRGVLELGPRAAGDEPVLIARRTEASVIVSRRRVEGARLAIERLGAEVIVLDDGFQHRALGRELDLLIVDAAAPFGDGRLLPRGRLREPPQALERAQLVIAHRGDGGALLPVAIEAPVEAAVRPSCLRTAGAVLALETLRGARVGLIAAIGRPERFTRTVETLGAEVVSRTFLPDHAELDEAHFARAWAEAEARGATLLLTTEKDAVRSPLPESTPLSVLEIELEVLRGRELLEARILGAAG